MGFTSSKPVSEKPKINWGGKQGLLDYIKRYTPSNDEVSRVRIFLYGPNGSGKSSFVNSVGTALLGRSTNRAHTNTSRDAVRSFTKKYTIHKIRKEFSKEFYPFVFSDIMGLEAAQNGGVQTEDIKLVMEGHVKEGYQFNPQSPLESDKQSYNPCPSEDDKVHLLVCVFKGHFPEMKENVIKKIKVIRDAAQELGIPHVAVFTHIDQIYRAKDVKTIYEAESVTKKMREFSAYSGFDMSHIFPVRNYSDGLLEGDDDMDTLILTALKHMLDYADDYIVASQQ